MKRWANVEASAGYGVLRKHNLTLLDLNVSGARSRNMRAVNFEENRTL
jgi:hypothetical protein